MLLLDAAGRVVASNASARDFWPARPLVGEAFASLFAFEILSTDPDFLEAQWEVLLASTLNRTTPLTLQPDTGGRPRERCVRLEPVNGGPAGYLATLQPPAPTSAALPSPDPDDATSAVRLLSEQGTVGFFDLNLKAGHVRLSAAWKKLLGYAAPELPDTIETWRALFHPDDSAAAPDKISRKISSGPRSINVEFRMKHRRDHWVWIQCVGLQVIGTPGEVDRVVGLHLDISERKELEDSLIANDARLQDLSGAGPLAAFELDFAHDSCWFSPAWEKLLGYAEGEFSTQSDSFAAALPPEEASVGVTEWLLGRAPGATAWVEVVKFRAKDGKPVRAILGAHRNVSRKRELLRVVAFACPLPPGAAAAEDALPAVLIDEAFRSLAEGVLLADTRRRVIFANAVAIRLLRTEKSGLLGQPLGDVFRLVNRQSGRPCDDPLEAAFSADNPLGLIGTDALAPIVEGEAPTPITWTACKTAGPDDQASGHVVVFRNPDELTLTPDERVKADRFGQLGQLASGIAHDFNNDLTTILGAVSLSIERIAKEHNGYPTLSDAEKAAYPKLSEAEKACYSALCDGEKACDAAQGLTKQLLEVAKGGDGTRRVCSPKEILEKARIIAAAGTSALVTVSIAEGADNVDVDRAQILQVFQNLIVNALQAMPPPPHQPRVQTQARNVQLGENAVESLPPGDYVEFEVRDNGSGIKPEHLGHIFDPFFTTKKHGTGLGLATVLKLVRKHGGQIRLVSEIGVGTVFTVYLPKAAAPVVQTRGSILVPRVRTHRVLFMDDDPKISGLTVTMLTNLGYTCDLAKNGEEAIALFKRYINLGKSHYDAVIMDLTIVGGMGGEECFAELRKLDPEVRAIVASGYDDDDMRREFQDKGFRGYLAKPYRQKDLGRLLKEVVG